MPAHDKHAAHVRSAERRCDMIWSSAAFVCGQTGLYIKKGYLVEALSTPFLEVESIFPVAHNEVKVKTTSLCPYVLMSKWTYLGGNTKRWTITPLTYSLVNLLTCLLVNLPSIVNFSVRILTLWALFLPPIANLAAKNRFSRGFVLVQKGGGCTCRQNEFLFRLTATNTHFFAICS